MKKWKNLKDNFMKSLKKKIKSGQAAESGKRYIYARQLSFLQQAGATIETQSSIAEANEDLQNYQDDTTNLDENNTMDEENFMNDVEPAPNRPPQYNPKSKKRKKDLESALIDFMQAPIPMSGTSEMNPDRAFF